MKSFDLLSNFFQFYVKKSKEKYHKNMSDYVEVENLPKANELINDDYVLINQNEDDAKVDMGTIKEFVRPPNASPTESGLVSTAEQTFSGKKNFTEIASNKATISSLNSSNATLTEATVQDLHITGNLIQDGETIETEIETLKVKDQVIVTRSGATTGMTDGEVTGIVAEKYDGQNNGVLIFGSDGIARVGDEGDAQPLATREETPNNGSIQVWDEQTQSFKSFPFGKKGQYLRQGENGLEYGSAVAVDGTASEEYVNQKVQEEATLRQNAIEEAKNLANATGTLAVEKGGTGEKTGIKACNSLLQSLQTGASTPIDTDAFISQYAGGSSSDETSLDKNNFYRRPVSALWEYIKGKISSVLGLTASNYSGTSAKSTNDGNGNNIANTYATNTEVNMHRTMKAGEIYYKTGYYKIKGIGYYARAIEFEIKTSAGTLDKLFFGQDVIANCIRLGNTPYSKYRYIAPTSNASSGTLLIKSDNKDGALIIFYTANYNKNTCAIEDSTEEEWNSGTDFTIIEK